jgi:hypothetical protein
MVCGLRVFLWRFWQFWRVIKSITYVGSTTLRGSNPTLSANHPIDNANLIKSILTVRAIRVVLLTYHAGNIPQAHAQMQVQIAQEKKLLLSNSC